MRTQYEHKRKLCLLLAMAVIVTLISSRMLMAEGNENNENHEPLDGVTVSGFDEKAVSGDVYYYSGEGVKVTFSKAVYQSYEIVGDDDTDIQITDDKELELNPGINEFLLSPVSSSQSADKKSLKICLDNTNPSVTMAVSAEDNRKLIVSVIEESPFEVYYSNTALDTANGNWMDSAKKITAGSEGLVISLSESSEPVTYYVYAVDCLGHIGFADKKLNKSQLDFTAPEVTVEPSDSCKYKDSGSYTYYYAGDAENSDKILEVVYTDASSGIDMINVRDIEGLDISLADAGDRVQVAFDNVKDGIYIIRISAYDNNSNRTDTTITIVYDATAPVISDLHLNAFKEYNGRYYNDEVIGQKAYVSLQVTDANLDNVVAEIGNKQITCTKSSNAGNIYTYTFPLGNDFKNQAINVYAIDKSGNQSEVSQLFGGKEITYDTTAPELKTFKITDAGKNEEMYTSTQSSGFWGNNIDNRIELDFNEENLIEDIDKDSDFTQEEITEILLEHMSVEYININDIEKEGGTRVNLTEKLKGNIQYNADTCTVSISGVNLPDGEYIFYVNATDMAENKMKEQVFYIEVDTKAPVLTMSRKAGAEYVPEGQIRQRSEQIHLEVQEANINKDKVVTWDVKVTDSNGEAIPLISYKINGVEQRNQTLGQLETDLMDFNNWKSAESTDAAENKEPVYTMDVTFLTEGNYTITEIYAYDNNEKSDTKNLKDSFVIDGTPPVINSISYSVTEKKYVDYQLISKDAIKVSVSVTDVISQIASVKLQYIEPDSKEEKEFDAVLSGKGQYICEIPYNGSAFKGTLISVVATDSMGNVWRQDLGKGVVIDKDSETFNFLNISIGDNTDTFAYNIYNKDVNLQLKAADTYAGLANVKYEINGVERKVDFTKAGTGLTYEWESEAAKLEATAKNEGDAVQVTLEAVDNAGNTKKLSRTYVIDITKPVIDISFDDDNDQTFYNHNRTAKITVTDKHVDTKDITVRLIKNGKSSLVKPKFKADDSGEVYTAVVKFTDDADYSMEVECKDLAGNQAVKKSTGAFTVDKTAPQMQITFDNNATSNGRYYSSKRTATIRIEEHNFDASKVSMNIGATLDGANISAPVIGNFTSNGDVHTAQITFDKDGDYTLEGMVTDKAGNQSAVSRVDTFTIDQTVPEISISGVEDGVSYNDSITPLIDISDVNFSANDIYITLTGLRTGIKEFFALSKNETAKTGTYRYEDFPHEIENDDYYILKASVHDMAGNVIEKTVEFKVNRFGSAYTLDTYTQSAVDKYYTNADTNFVIIEENVDEIVEAELYYSKDGDIVYLEKDSGFSVERSQGSDYWYTYRYTIDTSTIGQDGIYSFSLYSKDAVGNEMNNKAKEATLDICIDRTIPVCTISGVEKDGIYEETERDVTIEAYDNISLDHVDVYLNEEKTEYKAEDIVNDVISMTIAESNKKQELRVICYDMAGNVFDTADDGNISFTISTNALTMLLSKMASHIRQIIVACFVMAVLIISIIIWRMKRKRTINS